MLTHQHKCNHLTSTLTALCHASAYNRLWLLRLTSTTGYLGNSFPRLISKKFNMTRHFQFITVPDPTERISPRSRKLAHSHVLRQRHANARRSRIKSYQDKLGVRQSPPGDAVQTNNAFQSRMISYCMDPFSSLIRQLTSQEYRLLDYCTYGIGYTSPESLL